MNRPKQASIVRGVKGLVLGAGFDRPREPRHVDVLRQRVRKDRHRGVGGREFRLELAERAAELVVHRCDARIELVDAV